MRVAPLVTLSAEARQELEALAHSRREPHRVVLRAKIILLAAERRQDREIGARLGLDRLTVACWRQRFLRLGVPGLRKDDPRPGRKPKISADQVQQIITRTTQEKPPQATQWSTRTMAAAAGVSTATVRRIWHRHGLKPHLVRRFKLSNDPRFVEKLEDIVGLYLHPPEHALVWSAEEKSQIQALDRTQKSLPLKKGRCGTMTHDYKRYGTTTLFAALKILDGTVIGTFHPRHRHQEWIQFLKQIERETPPEKQIHLIADNSSSHKDHHVTAWLKKHPRFHMHYTSASRTRPCASPAQSRYGPERRRPDPCYDNIRR